VDLARLLIEHGPSASAHDNRGSTPLHRALFKDDVELAQFLFEHGADATAQDGRGSTPLHNATSGDMWD
jgi:ankyrin repeat protein